ncbi:hypothetical protein [Sphingomonas albertensis]|uniref:hypothetical protein n=1 Tax=Sphingomonas albertensis TaxID=2762591 RepID=UPI0037D9E8B5
MPEGLSNAGVTQVAIDAMAATIPVPATSTPPGVADTSALGSASPYARADHTHASKARKQIVTMGSAATTFAWTFPTAFPAGVVPIVSAIVQVPSGNTDLFNVQVMGEPTNAGCVFQINRVSSGLLALLTGALSINPTPIKATLHMLALEP